MVLSPLWVIFQWLFCLTFRLCSWFNFFFLNTRCEIGWNARGAATQLRICTATYFSAHLPFFVHSWLAPCCCTSRIGKNIRLQWRVVQHLNLCGMSQQLHSSWAVQWCTHQHRVSLCQGLKKHFVSVLSSGNWPARAVVLINVASNLDIIFYIGLIVYHAKPLYTACDEF